MDSEQQNNHLPRQFLLKKMFSDWLFELFPRIFKFDLNSTILALIFYLTISPSSTITSKKSRRNAGAREIKVIFALSCLPETSLCSKTYEIDFFEHTNRNDITTTNMLYKYVNLRTCIGNVRNDLETNEISVIRYISMNIYRNVLYVGYYNSIDIIIIDI